MISKYLLRLGLSGILIFTISFIYFYKTSGKFRQSIIAAWVSVSIFLSSLTTANAKPPGEADGFIPAQQQHQTRPRPTRTSNFFNGRSTNDGGGPGKPDDFGSDSDIDGLPQQFPRVESVEEGEKRVEEIESYVRQMKEMSDSEIEDDSIECPSAVTLEEALKLPDVRTSKEAKRYAEMNVPKPLAVNGRHHISGLMAAKKTHHAPELGLNPVSYGMQAEHVTLLRKMGLFDYLRKGYPPPPKEFLKDFQVLLRNICLDNGTGVLSDKPYTHNLKTPISIYENNNMSKSGKSSAIVVFDEDSGDMITLSKRGTKYMKEVKESGNMGTAGGTL